MPTTTYHILNLGAGVQSTTLYLMSWRQDEPPTVPRFDAAIFADTRDEPRAVYEHLQWLQPLGGPPIRVRTRGSLFDDLAHGVPRRGRDGTEVLGHKSAPFFVKNPDGSRGMVRRQCTQAYKVAVIEETIRREIAGLKPHQRFPDDVTVFQYFGLSYDEPGRIIAVQARMQPAGWSRPVFPLFDLVMTRRDCQLYNERHVPHPVPRSACKKCPLRRNDGWRQMRDESPAEFEEACRFDEWLRSPTAAASPCRLSLRGEPYLHHSLVPLRAAPIDTPESRGQQRTFGFEGECEGHCGV